MHEKVRLVHAFIDLYFRLPFFPYPTSIWHHPDTYAAQAFSILTRAPRTNTHIFFIIIFLCCCNTERTRRQRNWLPGLWSVPHSLICSKLFFIVFRNCIFSAFHISGLFLFAPSGQRLETTNELKIHYVRTEKSNKILIMHPWDEHRLSAVSRKWNVRRFFLVRSFRGDCFLCRVSCHVPFWRFDEFICRWIEIVGTRMECSHSGSLLFGLHVIRNRFCLCVYYWQLYGPFECRERSIQENYCCANEDISH